jgi:hypothetical protein
MMSNLRDTAYRIDPALWVRHVLGVEPAVWQLEFLRAPLGASILALTARQVGQDHHRRVGDCAFHASYAWRVVRNRLSRSTPERGSGAARA